MTTPPAWNQAPHPENASRPFAAQAILAIVIAGVGPIGTLISSQVGLPRIVVAAALIALAAIVLLRRRALGALGRFGVAAGAGALVGLVGASAGLGLWAGVSLLLAAWVTAGAPPLHRLPVPDPSAAVPVALLTVIASLGASRHGMSWQAVAPFGVACLLPLASTFGHGALERATRRVGHLAGSAVAAVGFVAMGVVVVIVPWIFHRVARIDPLAPRAGWVVRRRRDPLAQHPWAPESPLERDSPRARYLSTAALVVTAALVFWATPPGQRAVARLTSGGQDASDPFSLAPDVTAPLAAPGEEVPVLREPVPEGLEENVQERGEPFAAHIGDESWFANGDGSTGDHLYSWSQGWAFDPRVAWRPVNPVRFLDFTSTYVNVVEGRRLSWTPPACTCRRVTVWLYGGSTTYGLDQRDDHTIASELARVAYDRGMTVDVVNRGMPGQLSWHEAERFAWDLTHETPPDLVLFYDGVNDLWSTNALNDRETGDIKPLIDPTLLDLWRSSGRSDGPMPDAPPGGKFIGWPAFDPLDLQDMATVTMKRYDQSRTISDNTAAIHNVPVRYFWQPSRVSRPVIPSEPHGDTESENYVRLAQQLALDALPKDVINLNDVFDDNTEPLFTDDVHHNEKGARIVATAMYEELEPLLKRIEGKA